jgi:predicted nucleic acid-binding protein
MTQKFVIDASVALKLYVQAEDSEIARQLFDECNKEFQLYAPDIIVYELANRLRREYNADEAYDKIRSFINAYLEKLTPLFRKTWEFGMDSTGNFGLFHPLSYTERDLQYALDIARKYQLKGFNDATYVMLAQKLKMKLVTADEELLKKFPNDTISLRDVPLKRRLDA